MPLINKKALEKALKKSDFKSAVELSSKIGVGKDYIYALLQGKNDNPTVRNLIKLCIALNISFLELININCKEIKNIIEELNGNNQMTLNKYIELEESLKHLLSLEKYIK